MPEGKKSLYHPCDISLSLSLSLSRKKNKKGWFCVYLIEYVILVLDKRTQIFHIVLKLPKIPIPVLLFRAWEFGLRQVLAFGHRS